MASPRNKPWAVRIKRLMKASGVDAETLASQIGVCRSAVYHWTSGRCRPNEDAQKKLARRFGTTIAELNGWAA
jgi:transcriptional regulator with XRE-family HTH domain